MKISLRALKKYVAIPKDLTTEKLLQLIGARLVEVEGVEDLGAKYRGLKVVRVAECEKIPDTHLSLCQIDAGERGKLTQVVCGAHNVRKGMLAVWLPPETVVPATVGGEEFRLGVRPLRGYESHGMLASMMELDLGDDHSGIVEIAPEFCAVGTDFAEAFGLNDLIIDIENKSLTHRPDAFGLIGFAREVAGILGVQFEEPEMMMRDMKGTKVGASRASDVKKVLREGVADMQGNDGAVKVKIDEKLCAGYCAVVMELPEDFNQKSRYLTVQQVELVKAGVRPVSPLVDLTNWLMLLTGQPLHAFDYEKLVAEAQSGKGGGVSGEGVGAGEVGQGRSKRSNDGKREAEEVCIEVRAGREGESLELLDGRVIDLTENDIVVAAGEAPVALAGAMGGRATEVDERTRKVILEAATFSLYHIRKTSMRHGVFTEAVTRFTKGQPVCMAGVTMAEMVRELEANGGKMVGMGMGGGAKDEKEEIMVSVAQINAILGTEYSAEKIRQTLACVNIPVELLKDGMLKVVAPAFRTDLHIPEDVAEEVGRLIGYENIPACLPEVPLRYTLTNQGFMLKKRVRDCLSLELGAHEVLTYSFVSRKLEEKAGIDSEDSYEIANSISPELQAFRQWLMPSLAEKMYENSRAGYSKFALYELNPVTAKSWGLNAEGVPEMQNRLSLTVFGDYYVAKAHLEGLVEYLGLRLVVEPIEVKGAGRGGKGAKNRAQERSLRSVRGGVRGKGAEESGDGLEGVEGEFGGSGACEEGEKMAFPGFLEPVRSAKVMVEGRMVGYVGELQQRFACKLKLGAVVSGFELDFEGLEAVVRAKKQRKMPQISRFPSVYRDLTVKTPSEVGYGRLLAVIKEVGGGLAEGDLRVDSGVVGEGGLVVGLEVTPISAYQPKSEDGKQRFGQREVNYSFRLKFTAMDKTLSSEEVSGIMEAINKQIQALGAEVV